MCRNLNEKHHIYKLLSFLEYQRAINELRLTYVFFFLIENFEAISVRGKGSRTGVLEPLQRWNFRLHLLATLFWVEIKFAEKFQCGSWGSKVSSDVSVQVRVAACG
jgi:hypothetical protein